MNHRNSRYYDNGGGFYNNSQQQPSTSESFASGWFSSGSSQQRFAPPLQPPPGFNNRFNGPQFQQPPRQHFPPQNDLFSRRPSDHRSHSQKRSHSSLDFQQPGSAPRAPELRRQGQPPRINSNDASSPASKRFLQKQTSVDSQNSKHSPTRPQNGLQGPQNGPQEPKKLGKKAQKKANRLAQLTPAQQAQAQKDKEWKELFEKALAFLELAKPDEEVNALLHHLQPSRASWNELKTEIDRAIHRLMAPLDVAEVFVFGSTLTGLDFFGSDLDYFVELKSPPTTPEQTRKALQMLDKLARFSGEFRIICSILFARVPISRLLHVRSKTVCDLNLTSKFGYYNSCFIGNILRYDHRIKGLAVIVKLWSKQYKISERMIASNYCLIMLVIFYLQNLEQPMLGTIKENQEGREPKILDQKLRWNVYFNDSMNKSKNNKQTLRQLLVGFFEFYHKLNYTSYVLSMFNGDLIPRAQFENHPDFAFYREVVAQGELPHLNLKNENSFVVQDGFEQNLNVGIKVMKHAGIFFELIKISYEKCKEWKDLPFSQMLTMLLTSLPTPKAEKPVPKRKKQFTMTIHSVGGDLKLCQDILLSTDKEKVISATEQQAYFFKHTCEGTMKLLREVFLCIVVPEVNSAQETPFITEFKVISHVDTMNGRKKLNLQNETTYNNEITISRKMSEKKIRLDLDITMKISSKDGGKSVDIDLSDNGPPVQKSPIPRFGSLFAVHVGPALKYYLRQTWKEATQVSGS